ncbi:MAG TPA: hypothetical protein VJU17_05160 [Gemmatimonadales bacterium]|nr:hypothetical protein [Gemmatimonadales bacterium]
MSWTTDAQLDDFVVRFLNLTLPKSEWTHAAHLSVGAWHVHRYGVEEAVNRLRQGIRALNESHGTANTDSGGYHETITRAYAHLIEHFLDGHPESSTLVQRVAALLASPLAHKDALLEYYSKDRLMSAAARREWNRPDLKPLP